MNTGCTATFAFPLSAFDRVLLTLTSLVALNGKTNPIPCTFLGRENGVWCFGFRDDRVAPDEPLETVFFPDHRIARVAKAESL